MHAHAKPAAAAAHISHARVVPFQRTAAN
jgi:hypothetical protein